MGGGYCVFGDLEDGVRVAEEYFEDSQRYVKYSNILKFHSNILIEKSFYIFYNVGKRRENIMKKKQWLSCLAALCVCLTGCNGGDSTHTHDFSQKLAETQYLKTAATCASAAEYYYTCECGEVGDTTFFSGETLPHDYTAKVEDAKYIKAEKTCESVAEYFYSCVNCGDVGEATFTVEGFGDHVFDQEIPAVDYWKADATFTNPAEYYTSCACGLKGVNTFFYGEPLREYTEEEKVPYTPTSLTMTLYDTETSVYGFTYNTQSKPLKPVIQVSMDANFTNYNEYEASVTMATSYVEDGGSFTYYIAKAEVPLEVGKTQYYRAYDKHVNVASEIGEITPKDTKSTAFSFAHVSDSQDSSSAFGEVLKNLTGKMDFLVHTGDVVENSKWEAEWKAMLNSNFEYLANLPFMAISGNHETTYNNYGVDETFKHFNNNIPTQASTRTGYFYSFVYGNTKFIMLNTNDLTGNKLKDEQYNWLVNELENNDCTWTVVGMHNPMYSVGKYGMEESRNGICLALREQLQGIFAQYGVDIVLQGHDHVISRTYPIDANGQAQTETWTTVEGVSYSVDPNGVIYVMNGPAGAQTRDPYGEDTSLYYYSGTSKARSWAEFAIDGNKMVVTVKYYDGRRVQIYHEWGIEKSA